MPNIDYTAASILLNDVFHETVSSFSAEAQEVMDRLHDTLDTIFESNTQSYREVLLGCHYNTSLFQILYFVQLFYIILLISNIFT